MSRTFDISHRETAFAKGSRLAPVAASEPGETHPGKAGVDGNGNAEVEEEITKLVQRIFIYPAAHKARAAVAFCGVDKGNGCSWVCAQTAEALADQGAGKVCMIDANSRSPALHKFFHLENIAGFADSIKGARSIRELVVQTRNNNLWLLTSGAAGGELNSALNPAALRGTFSELRAEFDYLLIDTPALSWYADALLLGQFADGAILVVDSNSTRREPARVAKESLETAGVDVIGAVLNRRTYPIPQAVYRNL